MRQFELSSLENSNVATFLFVEGMDDHTAKSIAAILNNVEAVLEKATDELLQHLHQLKHSEKCVYISHLLLAYVAFILFMCFSYQQIRRHIGR